MTRREPNVKEENAPLRNLQKGKGPEGVPAQGMLTNGTN